MPVPVVYNKIAGRRACGRVRDGQTIELQPRILQVYRIDVLHYERPYLRVRIDCGRGTSIGSIGRDLGVALKVGGYLTKLRRVCIGRYDVADAVTVEALPSVISKRLIAL